MAGVPNKTTSDVRGAIAIALQGVAPELPQWLRTVHDGMLGKPKILADGTEEERWLVKPDPARALDIVASLSEYHIPKLARTEITGGDGKPLIAELKVYSQ